MSTEYFRVIDAFNDCYKKMLEIGKCEEVFRPAGGRRPDILTAKSIVEFLKTKKNIILRYNRYLTTCAPRLSISIDVDILPDPRKYSNSKQPMPTESLSTNGCKSERKKTTKNKPYGRAVSSGMSLRKI